VQIVLESYFGALSAKEMVEGMLAEPWHLRGHQETRRGTRARDEFVHACVYGQWDDAEGLYFSLISWRSLASRFYMPTFAS
jgi:hypothetical protein